jgi:hypothetical protein
MVQSRPARCSGWAERYVSGWRASIMELMVRASRCEFEREGTTAFGRTGSHSRRTTRCSGRASRQDGGSPLILVLDGRQVDAAA